MFQDLSSLGKSLKIMVLPTKLIFEVGPSFLDGMKSITDLSALLRILQRQSQLLIKYTGNIVQKNILNF